jgi:hypothetical protein
LNGAAATNLKLTAAAQRGRPTQGFWVIPVRPDIDGLWTSFNPHRQREL